MDRKFGAPWNVVIGEYFSFEITYEARFSMGLRGAPPPPPPAARTTPFARARNPRGRALDLLRAARPAAARCSARYPPLTQRSRLP